MKESNELLGYTFCPLQTLFSASRFINFYFYFILRAMENYCWTENRRLNSNTQQELQS